MTPNSCLSNPDTWTILSGQHKRPSSVPTTATCKLSFLNRSPKPLIHSLKEWRCSQNSYKWQLYSTPSHDHTYLFSHILLSPPQFPLCPTALHPRLLPSCFCGYLVVTTKVGPFKLLIFDKSLLIFILITILILPSYFL